MNTIKIKYFASVCTDAGWRGVWVRANAVMVSAKMAEVTEVYKIGGETPAKSMSVSGSRRQAFNGLSIAQREMGAKKRLSACQIIEIAHEVNA
jgi:hypothetical protein